jgi:hypothetical protein
VSIILQRWLACTSNAFSDAIPTSGDDTFETPQAFTAHIQSPRSRREYPLAPSYGMSITTSSVPATPLGTNADSISSHPSGTSDSAPSISLETQNFGAHLTPQGPHQLGDGPMRDELRSSIPRLSNPGPGQYENFEAGHNNPHVSPPPIQPLFYLTRPCVAVRW